MALLPILGLGLFDNQISDISVLDCVSAFSYHPCPLHLSVFFLAFKLVFFLLCTLSKLSSLN